MLPARLVNCQDVSSPYLSVRRSNSKLTQVTTLFGGNVGARVGTVVGGNVGARVGTGVAGNVGALVCARFGG